MKPASLRWRVLVVLALAAVVPTVVVGALAIARARDDVEHEVQRGALAHIRALGAALDDTLQSARRTVELAAATWADQPDPRATALLLRRLRREVPIVRALSIVDPAGRLISGDPVPGTLDVGSHSFGGYIGDAELVDPTAPPFGGAAGRGQAPTGDPTAPPFGGAAGRGQAPTGEGRRVVRLVVQARGRTGELMGVMVASLDLGFVRDAIAAARLGTGARVLVVDGTGVPVATSEGDIAASSLAGKDPAVDRALASSVEGTLSAGGWVSAYRNLASYQSLRGVRWAILHQQPEADAYALARRTTRDTLIIGGAALALALALGAWFATKLTRPLAALARRADAIAGGTADLGADAARTIGGPGEIGVLAQRLDEMARRIAERSELAAALARGDRLASVGVMSAQVAHEINNPLTTVLGYAKLLLEDKPEAHPDRAGLELIASEAERMKGIVGGMLEYARTPRTDEGRACQPAAVMRHAAALLEPQLKRAHATLRTDAPTDGAQVAIEAHALQQVLVNLVQNAAQAMTGANHHDGTITVTVRPAPGGIATAITVSDDGPGIAVADRPRVFDPFFTTKAAGVGTGLGLAVCKHLITTAGGTIEVADRSAGRGAEFRLVLPNAVTEIVPSRRPSASGGLAR